jgi:hypothetical protein
MLVSKKTTDFDPAMRSTRTISILFRRKYEGDLGAIATTVGNRTSGVISQVDERSQNGPFSAESGAVLWQVRIEDIPTRYLRSLVRTRRARSGS